MINEEKRRQTPGSDWNQEENVEKSEELASYRAIASVAASYLLRRHPLLRQPCHP